MTDEQVILVNESDEPVGTAEKLHAHVEGLLHRAVSVLVFNARGELLLQQRNHEKYHSGGLWSNTCCSHPRAGETAAAAAQRRLYEEMGVSCALAHAFTFRYEARVGPLVEREIDHVFTGSCEEAPQPDPREVSAWAWVDAAGVLRDVADRPDRYTAWFPLLLDQAVTAASYPASQAGRDGSKAVQGISSRPLALFSAWEGWSPTL